MALDHGYSVHTDRSLPYFHFLYKPCITTLPKEAYKAVGMQFELIKMHTRDIIGRIY